MAHDELIKITIEEFSRLQNYMKLVDNQSEAYQTMKQRYIELKIILTSSGINITQLDYINE